MSNKPNRSSHKTQSPDKSTSISVWIPILIALISAAASIIVAYLQVGVKPNAQPDVTPSETIQPSATPPAVTITSTLLPCPADMIYIPAGEFIFGADEDDEEAEDDEIFFKKIYLDAFCIDRTEVSNEAYAKFNLSSTANNLPVVNITWFQAVAYCQWLGRELPTEYEWEKAARGENGNTYPWGEGKELSKANVENSRYRLSPVDSYENWASPYGVLNMAGNASEWTSDWYDSEWYSQLPIDIGKNPTGPLEPGEKGTMVVRGGDLGQTWKNARTTARFGGVPPHEFADFLGFRCARTPQ